MLEVLKFGAIGICLAILAYTAALLHLELRRPMPRPEARNLIVIFMAFGLVALGIATFIELKSKSALVLASAEKIDSYIDGKVMAEINDLQPDVRRRLTVFTNGICGQVAVLLAAVDAARGPTCKITPTPP